LDPKEAWTLTATQAAAKIAAGALSAEQMTRACLDRIAAAESKVQAFAHLDAEHALSQARELDERRRSGAAVGLLHGVPVAVKDIIDTKDYPTECGSPLLAGRRPYRDATVVSKLRAAGAVIIGKSVTTEFAFFHPGPTRNPHDQARTPGGSSSGSAAAVGAAMVPVALGSQTNGSVIRPASFCGVFAVKPSHGLISRAGILTLSRALDHVGVFARTIDDLALLLEVLAGHDPADPDTRPAAAPAFRRVSAEAPPLPPRLAFVRTPIWDKADASTRAAFEELAAYLGDNAATVDLPESFADAWSAHRQIMAADMADNLGELVARGGTTSATLHDFLGEGRRVLAADYLAALKRIRVFNAGLAEIFNYYDAILTPATAGVAPKSLETTGNPAFCSLWTLTGLPAVSLPILEGEGRMPLGVQLVGPRDDDARLLRTANWLLQTLSHKRSKRRRKEQKAPS
jgi:Asp-tRNA(Asn)/Glu-tRNA(Gln) amidotransferase A subunit family amidase